MSFNSQNYKTPYKIDDIQYENISMWKEKYTN